MWSDVPRNLSGGLEANDLRVGQGIPQSALNSFQVVFVTSFMSLNGLPFIDVSR